MAKRKAKKKKVKKRPARRVRRAEVGLKTRILALLMLMLAASIGLWFAEFQPIAILLWLLIVFAGGYAVFEFELFVSKALLVVAALVMEFLSLEGVPNLLVIGSPGNLLMFLFAVLDIILIYALYKM